MSFKQFFENMSGTSKQKYGEDLYDPKEFKKWKDRQEKIYGKIGEAGDRYGTQAEKFLGLYGEDRAGADKYRGLAEREFGQSRAEIDRAKAIFGRAEGDVEKARGEQKIATELMSDRDHYANLKRRSMARTRAGENARRELESIRGRLGKPSDSGLTRSLLDAFKRTTASNRKIIDSNAALLSKTNPAAAARLTQEFNEKSLLSLGQLKQKGVFTDQQLSDNKLTREAGMLVNETSLINMGATEDTMMNAIHSGQIRDRLNAGSAFLNTASATGNIGKDYLRGAGALATLGSQYGRLGSDLDRRGTSALNMTSKYEGLKYGTLQDRMSISNIEKTRQTKFRMSDAAAKARVDSFNNQRANMGFQNTMKLARTVASVAGATYTGGATLAAEAALREKERQQREESTAVRTSDSSGGDLDEQHQYRWQDYQPVRPVSNDFEGEISDGVSNNDAYLDMMRDRGWTG